MSNFYCTDIAIDTQTVVPVEPIESDSKEMESEYDSFITIYTQDDVAQYKFGHKDDKEKQLAILLSHMYPSDMFEGLRKIMPTKIEAGKEVVSMAIELAKVINDTASTVAIIQPATFGHGG